MSETLGPAAYSDLMNRQFGDQVSYSPDTLKKIDQEVSNILNRCYAKTKSILSLNYIKLVELSEFLIEKETISSDEFDLIFNK
jgi:cell division protease FtsH